MSFNEEHLHVLLNM